MSHAIQLQSWYTYAGAGGAGEKGRGGRSRRRKATEAEADVRAAEAAAVRRCAKALCAAVKKHICLRKCNVPPKGLRRVDVVTGL